MARRHYHPKTGEFGDYMQHKREKLRLQQHYGDTDDAIFIGSEESDSPKKKLFYGVVYYSTGINHITEIELRKLVIENGGMHETYNTPLVTHFVAKHLSEAKASELRGLKRHNFFVVRSEWFTDSLAANRRLPEHKYSLIVWICEWSARKILRQCFKKTIRLHGLCTKIVPGQMAARLCVA